MTGNEETIMFENDLKNISIWIFTPKIIFFQVWKYFNFHAKKDFLSFFEIFEFSRQNGFQFFSLAIKFKCLNKCCKMRLFWVIFKHCLMQLHTSDNYCFVWKWQELWKIFRIDELADSLYLQFLETLDNIALEWYGALSDFWSFLNFSWGRVGQVIMNRATFLFKSFKIK